VVEVLADVVGVEMSLGIRIKLSTPLWHPNAQ
jgi:hypothetical protein